ncbi:hypothetical protein BH11BAC7_BH11BAC7_32410 [soil metagenome]
MNSPHVRIFLATSQISTVYAMMISKASRTIGMKDVMFLDGSKRRKSLSTLIKNTAEVYNWDLVHDFSILMEEDYDFNPTITKSITRKVKAWPMLRWLYKMLLGKKTAVAELKYRDELKQVLASYLEEGVKISLFLQTRTFLNRSLLQLFPDAEVNYLEHGMGDYYYMLDPKTVKGNFYCLFAESYKRFLAQNGNSSEWVKQLPGISTFAGIAQKLNAQESNPISVPGDKPYIFILLEAVDMYEVKPAFWSEYPDHIFAQLKNPSAYHYLLKPHPMQSSFSIAATKEHFDKQGYCYTLITKPDYITRGAEVLFQQWADKTEHVFCLFSSSVYYLSKLYSDDNITFWYSTEFLSRYISNAPPQYYKLFKEIRPLIENVLVENCKPY